MVVAEVLTGISLVKASVDFVKQNISTVSDIKDIAKQIDGFFEGESQMNKAQKNHMSISEQFGSIEKTATDFIDRKLLEEQRNELKQLINMRWPNQAGQPSAWDQIIAERAKRIQEAKEAFRLEKIAKKKRHDEIVHNVEIGVGVIIAICVGVGGLIAAIIYIGL